MGVSDGLSSFRSRWEYRVGMTSRSDSDDGIRPLSPRARQSYDKQRHGFCLGSHVRLIRERTQWSTRRDERVSQLKPTQANSSTSQAQAAQAQACTSTSLQPTPTRSKRGQEKEKRKTKTKKRKEGLVLGLLILISWLALDYNHRPCRDPETSIRRP
jgi:hypothetical protein